MNIRRACSADSDAVQMVVSNVLHEYGLAFDMHGADSDLQDIESSYQKAGGNFFVVEEDGAVIASFGLRRVSSEDCELRKMYCLSSYRGRGFGRKMMDYALQVARKEGFKRMYLETASPLKEAIAMYKSYGFTSFSLCKTTPRCDQALELYL